MKRGYITVYSSITACSQKCSYYGSRHLLVDATK